MVTHITLGHNDDTDNPKIFDAQTLTKFKTQWKKWSLFDQKVVLNDFCTTKNKDMNEMDFIEDIDIFKILYLIDYNF